MAVDANVLIFERIREEIKAGKSIQRAINEGYSNAFSTIADANITTLITAIILFAVGTGPIKRFCRYINAGYRDVYVYLYIWYTCYCQRALGRTK